MRSQRRGLGRIAAGVRGGISARRRLIILVGCCALQAGAAGARPLSGPGAVYAVIVGYNGGRPGLPALNFADDDAIRFSLLLHGLASPERPVRVWTLTDVDAETADALARAGLRVTPSGPPTRSAIASAIAEVRRELAAAPAGAPPPVFYFIYAGHGLGERVLLKPEAGAEAAITGYEIIATAATLARVRSSLHSFVFMDACRSQSLFSARGGDPETGPDLAAQARSLERAAAGMRIGLMTAATSGHSAGEVRKLAAGYFSHVLASGMSGAADANGDQVVSFGELASFVTTETQHLDGQEPWFRSQAVGDLSQTAIDLRERTSRLDLSAAAPGHYRVRAIAGLPIFAEAFKREGHPLRLALPAGHYQLVRLEKGPDAHALIELRAGEVTDGARAWVAREVRARGDGGEGVGSDGSGGGGGGVVGTIEDSDDEGTPMFSETFGPETVAALKAGYQAGREPPLDTDGPQNTLAVSAGVATSPFGLGGAEPGLAISYRRRFADLFAGLHLGAARSYHQAGESYRLDRYAALAEVGRSWSPRTDSWRDRFEARLAVDGGTVSVVRRADAEQGPARGELAAPALGAAAGLAFRTHGALSIDVSGRYLVEWLHLDGARRAHGHPSAELGVAYEF